MGLIARIIEAAGIPTVCLIGLRDIAEKVRPPRSLHLKWPFGHPLGEAGDRFQQLTVLAYALEMFYTISTPATIVAPPWTWRRMRYDDPRESDFRLFSPFRE